MTSHALYKEILDSIGIIQKVREITWATERIKDYFKRPIDSFVEFGSNTGGSFAFIAKTVAADDAILIAVDPKVLRPVFERDWIEQLLGRKFICLAESSHLSGQFLADTVGHKGIELLHIDSVHTAAYSEKEWSIVKPLMASPSIVMVHDIKAGSRATNYPGYLGEDIEQLSTGDWFQRIKYGFSYEEKKVNGRDPDSGIGILYL